MAVNKWGLKNPERYKEIQKNYYSRNREQAKLRSRRQNLKGKISYAILTSEQRKKVDAQVEKLLTESNI